MKLTITHGSLFSGIGGFDLAASWLGWKNIFQCETDPFCRRVLRHRFPNTNLYEDIRNQSFEKHKGRIDVLSGGFPCQPFSTAGKRKGADDNRYLWSEMLRVIKETRPRWVIGENVAGILSMVQSGSEIEVESQASIFEENNTETILEQEYVVNTVCSDLKREGYTVLPVVIPACAVGAPHRRDRVWFIANRNGNDSAGCRFEKAGCKASTGEVEEQKRERIRSIVARTDDAGSTPNADSSKFKGKHFEQQGQGKPHGRNSGDIPTWSNFPSQPPVCGGNDGIPKNWCLSPFLSGEQNQSKHVVMR